MTDRPAPDETTPTVATSGDRGVGIGRDVTNSNIFTGDIKIEAAAGPAATALHQLRAPVGDFVGREPEIDTLITALRRETRGPLRLGCPHHAHRFSLVRFFSNQLAFTRSLTRTERLLFLSSNSQLI